MLNTPELIEWADLIFVMERDHKTKLAKAFKPYLGGKRVVCLNIPDKYQFMDPALGVGTALVNAAMGEAGLDLSAVPRRHRI